MANVTRFDPFNLSRMEPFGEGFEDFFRNMFRPARWAGGEVLTGDIRVDVEEDDKAYVVKAELPGIDKKNIDVQIDGNTVSIRAEAKRESDVKEGGKTIRSERYYGTLLRSFTLPDEIDRAEASAKYDNGVLNLRLPKRPGSPAKKLAVS